MRKEKPQPEPFVTTMIIFHEATRYIWRACLQNKQDGQEILSCLCVAYWTHHMSLCRHMMSVNPHKLTSCTKPHCVKHQVGGIKTKVRCRSAPYTRELYAVCTVPGIRLPDARDEGSNSIWARVSSRSKEGQMSPELGNSIMRQGGWGSTFQ